MTDPRVPSETLRMSAYYYSFEPTGNPAIDRILSAVACAGKAFHHTEEWGTDTSPYTGHVGATPIDWIQNAANDAASDLRAQLAQAEPVVWRYKFRDRAALDAFLASENCAKPMADHDRLAQCVDRFLNWPLPKTFSPDCGISFSRTLIGPDKVPGSWPVGTNLFTADEARQMLEHVLAAAPESEEGEGKR